MFILKKTVSLFFYPLPFCILLLAISSLLTFTQKATTTAKALLITATLLLILFSTSFIPNALIHQLERQNHPLNLNNIDQQDIEYIVILGGGAHDLLREEPINKLSPPSLARLIEGIRIHKAIPSTQLILSGGNYRHQKFDATEMRLIATHLGVPSVKILEDNISLDTEQQAINISKIVGRQPFILVTSASHMNRSLLLFQNQGTHPIPAPSNYTATKNNSWHSLVPRTNNLNKASAAIHEYIGILWAKLNSKN